MELFESHAKLKCFKAFLTVSLTPKSRRLLFRNFMYLHYPRSQFDVGMSMKIPQELILLVILGSTDESASSHCVGNIEDYSDWLRYGERTGISRFTVSREDY